MPAASSASFPRSVRIPLSRMSLQMQESRALVWSDVLWNYRRNAADCAQRADWHLVEQVRTRRATSSSACSATRRSRRCNPRMSSVRHPPGPPSSYRSSMIKIIDPSKLLSPTPRFSRPLMVHLAPFEQTLSPCLLIIPLMLDAESGAASPAANNL